MAYKDGLQHRSSKEVLNKGTLPVNDEGVDRGKFVVYVLCCCGPDSV